MIEPVMYMGIGFLCAALIGVALVPLIHGRAVRLTVRRLEASLPQSMSEIRADKDAQRAAFAMGMRRLEVHIEKLRNKNATQLVEIGRKSDNINRLTLELNTLKAVAAKVVAAYASRGPIQPIIGQPVAGSARRRDGDVIHWLRSLARRRFGDRQSRIGESLRRAG
jgi:hypothetical protein